MAEAAASKDMQGSTAIDRVDMDRVLRRGLGGTDVAAILGLSPWKTPHDVWLDKLGLREPPPQTEAAKWGLLLEPIIAQQYAERLGVAVRQPQPRFVRHPDHQWALGALDYVVEGQAVGLDCKVTRPEYGYLWGEEGTDEVPDDVLVQQQWYLFITGYRRWDVAVLMGYKMAVYSIRPDPDLHRVLFERAREFWHEFVLTKTMPPVDYSRGARTVLETVYPRDRGAIRAATDEETALALAYKAVEERIRELERERDHYRNLLCAAIGNDAGLQGDWGRVTWKLTKGRTTTDWEAVARALYAALCHAQPAAEAPALPPFEEWVRPHTAQAAGFRRFFPQWTKDRKEGGRS